MIINKCPDLKRKYKIKTHLVCKFIQDASESPSLRRCGMEEAFTTWILKGKSKNNRVVCVSTHYSPLIPSNAVWSLEAGTLISCFFCFTNSVIFQAKFHLPKLCLYLVQLQLHFIFCHYRYLHFNYFLKII